MEVNAKHLHDDILSLKRDIALIKYMLMSEGKLTEWAKKELAKARKDPESSYTDLENL
ncbi:MAG: hypothetical protein AABW71_00350 [Nanoarchaeota archaeon]